MSGWQITFGILSGLSGIAALTAWFLLRPQIRKLRAEARKLDIDADDAHLRTIVDAVVDPLKERVDQLNSEVKELRTELRGVSRLYRAAQRWIRAVLDWQVRHHPDIDPPMPDVPPEIHDDL